MHNWAYLAVELTQRFLNFLTDVQVRGYSVAFVILEYLLEDRCKRQGSRLNKK